MAAMGTQAVQDGQTYLVWCFEHCLKTEHAEARENLKDLADAFGVEFVCEKKSMGLLSWLESRAGTGLLVAEWREAKPIMEELGNRGNSCNLSTCVVTRTDKPFRRVCHWANQKSWFRKASRFGGSRSWWRISWMSSGDR